MQRAPDVVVEGETFHVAISNFVISKQTVRRMRFASCFILDFESFQAGAPDAIYGLIYL